MLVIKTIKLTSNQIKRSKRLAKVRVGYGQHVCTNKYQARVHSQQIIEWKQDMTLPILFKKPLQFEFYTTHQFGYNPEQIDGVCYAKIVIQNYRKTQHETLVTNSNNQVVGRVYFQFQIINDYISRKTPQIQTNIYVSSMLAHFDHYYGQKGFFQVCIGQQYSATPDINFIAGQLLWAEKLILPPFSDLCENKELETKIFIDDINVGNACIKIKEMKKKSEKFLKIVIISAETNEKCGMLFMDIHIKQKRIKNEIEEVRKKSKSQVSLPSLGPVKFHFYGVGSNKKMKSQKSERNFKIAKTQKNQTRMTERINQRMNPLLNNILSWKLKLTQPDEKQIKVSQIDRKE